MIKDVLLNNGVKMPQEGFGVFQITDLAQCTQVVLDAIETGYRLFDTAAAYNNEAAVGEAIRQSGLKREEFFITTKIGMDSIGEEKARAGFERQLKLLGLDYLDLYLVHMPWGDYYGAWRTLEALYKEGRIRAIGVSNFSPERLMDLKYNFDIIPAVNQIELHPLYQREDELKFMRDMGIGHDKAVIPDFRKELAAGCRTPVDGSAFPDYRIVTYFDPRYLAGEFHVLRHGADNGPGKNPAVPAYLDVIQNGCMGTYHRPFPYLHIFRNIAERGYIDIAGYLGFRVY